MTQTDRYHNSTIYNDNYGLITIGGYDNKNSLYLSSVEILNKDEQKWQYLQSMNNKRDSCSVISIQNKLFVFREWMELDILIQVKKVI